MGSDSVTVLKSRIKTFLFSQAFSLFPLLINTLPAPAPLKLRVALYQSVYNNNNNNNNNYIIIIIITTTMMTMKLIMSGMTTTDRK